MGKLGKILAPIVAVLAIAAAVLNFLVSDGFKKYQDRASRMAKGLVDTSAKLDSETNTGKGSAVKFTAAAPGVKESGTLSYADFKADSNKFNSTVAAVTEIADKVVAQRNDLTEAVKDISIKLGMKEDDIAADDMKNIGSYQAKIALAKSYVDAYEQRDKEFVTYIKKYAGSLGRSAGNIDRKPEVRTEKAAAPKKAAAEDGEDGDDEAEEAEPAETKVAKFESNGSSLEALNRAIVDMKACRDSYETAIRGVKTAISNYGEWKADVSYISERNYQTVLPTLASDLAGINGKLGELNQTKAELAKKNSELAETKDKVEALKKEKADAEKKIEEFRNKVKELSSLLGGEDAVAEVLDDDSLPVVKRGDVKEDTVGKVLIDNSKWNYVITDLGNKKVAVGTAVAISASNGSYLASGKVVKVESNISMIEITRRADKASLTGATVYISKGDADEESED